MVLPFRILRSVFLHKLISFLPWLLILLSKLCLTLGCRQFSLVSFIKLLPSLETKSSSLHVFALTL
jgi:hypothetical protein